MKETTVVEDRSKKPFQFSGYYFSEMLEIINQIGRHYVARSPKDWERGDVVIFNYPEESFKEDEIKKIDELIKSGKIVIFTAYSNGEDGVCEVINDISKAYGIKLLSSCIRDSKNCADIHGKKDDRMVVTTKVYKFNKNVEKVVFGYCAPIKAQKKAKIFVESEKGDGIAACYEDASGGKLVAIGTCTFWDNYSIKRFDNEKFVRNLLTCKLNSPPAFE